MLRGDLVVDVVVDIVGAAVTADSGVAAAILEEADTDGALVCIASHGRSGLGAVLLGSTTEQILRTSSRPVLVVGPHCAPGPWPDDAVLVASLDGSPRPDTSGPSSPVPLG